MKISASIYSDTKRPLETVIRDLMEHQVDLLHVDCNDNPSVFEDIAQIRQWTDTPIDLHLITSDPSKFEDLLRQHPVEYLTLQYEELPHGYQFPSFYSGKKGLAITTETDVSVFGQFQELDFLLIMATVPGQSGGVFDSVNFQKIRKFNNLFPTKRVHVDGGVNAEVSFILRNMGVYASVSGSYLFNAASVGHALMNLTNRSVASHFKVSDFMIPLQESPVVDVAELTFRNVLEQIEKGKVGFTLILDEQKFIGISSNADMRKSLLSSMNDLNQLDLSLLVNRNAITLNEEATVFDMLHLIRSKSFPISYLPVVNKAGEAKGIITFVNLIKGEL